MTEPTMDQMIEDLRTREEDLDAPDRAFVEGLERGLAEGRRLRSGHQARLVGIWEGATGLSYWGRV